MPEPTEKECFVVLDRDEQLWEIYNASAIGSPGLTDTQLRASAVPISLPSGAVTDTWTALTSASGTAAAAGASKVTFWTSSDWAGTVNGITVAPSTTVDRTSPTGKTLPAYTYTRTAGTLNVARMS